MNGSLWDGNNLEEVIKVGGVTQGWGVRWTVRLLCVLRKTQGPSQQESRKGRTKVENPLLLLSSAS